MKREKWWERERPEGERGGKNEGKGWEERSRKARTVGMCFLRSLEFGFTSLCGRP